MEAREGQSNQELSIENGSQQTVIPDFAIDTLARCLLPKIQAYFESQEGQAEFEEWKKQQDNT